MTTTHGRRAPRADHTRHFLGLALAGLVVSAVACTSMLLPAETASPAPTAPQQAQSAPAVADPYVTFLAGAPAGSVKLSRESAQARAYLGCGTTFAPGTVDRALADAYRPGVCETRS